MLATLRNFFDTHLTSTQDSNPHAAQQRAHVAAAALLSEVVAADDHISDTERQQLLITIQGQFGLSSTQAQELATVAKDRARSATDLHEFTAQINQAFDATQKIWLVEALWRVAYADKILHRHEEYLVRKVADLLYVSNTATMAAKHRAQTNQ